MGQTDTGSSHLIEGVESRLGCRERWLCLGQVLLTVLLLLLHLEHDEGHSPLLLVGHGLLSAHLVRLHANHLNQLVSVFVFLPQLPLLCGQPGFQAIHLPQRGPGLSRSNGALDRVGGPPGDLTSRGKMTTPDGRKVQS